METPIMPIDIKLGANLIGEEAIPAKDAVLMTFSAKVPIVIELQKKIMQAIKCAASDNICFVRDFEYVNEDPIIDEWIEMWLADLKYVDINIEDVNTTDENGEEVYEKTLLSFSFEPSTDEEEISEEETTQESEEKQSNLFDDIVKTAKNDAENAPKVEYP